MKKAFITTGLLLIAVFSFAQSSDVKVLLMDRTIGKITATQEELKTKEYVFPELIYRSYIDTISKSLTVQLRGKNDNGRWMNRGNILFYDLDNKRIKWTKNINYTTNSLQQLGSTLIFRTSTNKSHCLNIENGKNLWKAKNSIFFVDNDANIGVGYKFEAGMPTYTELEGINLKTGKAMWQREVNREYGWNEVFQLKDSEWIIASAGLHTINTHNGSGWSYKAVTGEKDYSGTAAASAVGIGLALFTGFGFYATGYDFVGDIVSNVYSDSAGFYLASKDIVSRINKNDGTVNWYHLFPAGTTSTSFLWAKDNLLFMLNYGYASNGSRSIFYGTPFFATFNKENGEQKFLSTINITKNPILDFKIKDDVLLLVFKDRIMKYSLFNGSQIIEKIIDNKELGELYGFVGNRTYIDAGNSILANLVLTDISKNFILTRNDKILITDNELNVVGEIDVNQLYTARLKVDDYLIITKDKKTFILNNNNEKVAEIDIELKPVLIGDKLYSVQENSFFEIDADNLIQRLNAIKSKRQESIALF